MQIKLICVHHSEMRGDDLDSVMAKIEEIAGALRGAGDDSRERPAIQTGESPIISLETSCSIGVRTETMINLTDLFGEAVKYLLVAALGWLVATLSFQRRLDNFEKRI